VEKVIVCVAAILKSESLKRSLAFDNEAADEIGTAPNTPNTNESISVMTTILCLSIGFLFFIFLYIAKLLISLNIKQ
jgi:hypothetical protein